MGPGAQRERGTMPPEGGLSSTKQRRLTEAHTGSHRRVHLSPIPIPRLLGLTRHRVWFLCLLPWLREAGLRRTGKGEDMSAALNARDPGSGHGLKLAGQKRCSVRCFEKTLPIVMDQETSKLVKRLQGVCFNVSLNLSFPYTFSLAGGAPGHTESQPVLQCRGRWLLPASRGQDPLTAFHSSLGSAQRCHVSQVSHAALSPGLSLHVGHMRGLD